MEKERHGNYGRNSFGYRSAPLSVEKERHGNYGRNIFDLYNPGRDDVGQLSAVRRRGEQLGWHCDEQRRHANGQYRFGSLDDESGQPNACSGKYSRLFHKRNFQCRRDVDGKRPWLR